METLKTLRTSGNVIDALGGELEVGGMVGAGYKAVNNWRNFGHFPANTQVRLLWELCQKGYTASPRLWKQVGCERLGLMRISQQQ